MALSGNFEALPKRKWKMMSSVESGKRKENEARFIRLDRLWCSSWTVKEFKLAFSSNSHSDSHLTSQTETQTQTQTFDGSLEGWKVEKENAKSNQEPSCHQLSLLYFHSSCPFGSLWLVTFVCWPETATLPSGKWRPVVDVVLWLVLLILLILLV